MTGINRFPRNTPIPDRIMGTVSVDVNGCWIWQAKTSSDGRPSMKIGRKTYVVSRISYETFVGVIPPGMLIRHTCDTARCVNPNHLLTGTQADNMKDMVSRRRSNGGGARKLTPAQIQQILDAKIHGGSVRSVARDLGITDASARYWIRRPPAQQAKEE